ncbi:hypothetical protein JCM9279_003599 [Rhodotorula babjevae]
MALLLPATLDKDTVSTIIAALDDILYPPPTPGLEARIAVLLALTGLSLIFGVLYLWLHYRSTVERPRRRCLWLVRRVERPSGRYLVINPRTALTSVVVSYGLYELAYVATFWAVYGLHMDQAVAIGIRNFNAIPLWLGGWILSWSGLQAFLVAVESERKFMSARAANWLFIGVGTLLVSLNLAIVICTTVVTVRMYWQYLELREALVAINESLAGRVPTILDFLPLQDVGTAFLPAASSARTTNIVQGALAPVFIFPILAVNYGGLALAQRMRRQIRDNIELLESADRIGLSSRAALGFRKERKSDTSYLRALAQQRPGECGTTTSMQARKILALQKAVTDLETTVGVIAFVATFELGAMILIAYTAASDRLVTGQYNYFEAAMLTPEWIYTIGLTASLLYLVFNALRARRRLLKSGTSTTNAEGTDLGPRTLRLGVGSVEQVQLEAGVERKGSHGSASIPPSPYDKEAIISLPPLAAVDTGERPSPVISPGASRLSLGGGAERRSSSWLGPASGLQIPFAVTVTVETSETLE